MKMIADIGVLINFYAVLASDLGQGFVDGSENVGQTKYTFRGTQGDVDGISRAKGTFAFGMAGERSSEVIRDSTETFEIELGGLHAGLLQNHRYRVNSINYNCV